MAKWKDNSKRPSGRERAQKRQREAAQREEHSAPAPSNSPKADWRTKKASSRASSQRDSPGWAHGETDPTAWKRAKSRIVLLTLGVVLLSLIGAFIYYAYNLPTRTRMVVVVPTEGLGQDKFTSIPNGQRVTSTFEEVEAGPNRSLVVTVGDANSLLKQEDLSGFAQKHDLYGGGPKRNVITFYIAGAGVVDDEGNPYFLSLGDAPFNRKNWISLETFFKNLMQMRDVKDREVQKVLFIDSQRLEPLIDPRLMVDTFPSAVEALLNKVELEDAGIHVVLSHETGQRSCYAPELGRSVFAHFLARGLAGEADGCLDGESKDDFISLSELAAFVRSQVATWVRNHRGFRQTPVVYPAIDDSKEPVQIIFAKGSEEPRDDVESAIKSVKDRHSEIQAKWSEFEQELDANNVTHADLQQLRPFGIARFENLMTRLESLVPQEGSTEYVELKDEVDRVVAQLFDLSEFESIRVPASLAEAVSRGALPTERLSRDDGQGDRLTQWIDAHAIPEEDKRIEAIDALKLILLDERITSVDENRWLMWTWLRRMADGPTQEHLNEAVAIIDEFYEQRPRTRPRTEWIEIKFLQMLERYIDWQSTDTAKISQAIGLALATREKAESIAASFDRRAWYWIETPWKELEQRRRIAEDRLYSSEFDSAIQAFSTMNEEYDELSRKCEQMADKLDLHQEALHALPYLIAWEFRRRSVILDRFYEPDGTLSQDQAIKKDLDRFREIIEELKQISHLSDELGKELYVSLGQTRFEDIDQIQTSELKRLLTVAIERYDESCRSLVDDNREASNSALIEITHALMCPLADLGRRAELRERFNRILEGYTAGGAGGKVDPRPAVSWHPSLVRDFNDSIDDLFPKSANQPFFDVESRVRDRMEEVLERLDRKGWSTSDVTDAYTAFEGLEADWMDQEANRDRYEQRDNLFGVNHFLMKFLPYMVAFRSDISVEPSEVRAVGAELYEAHQDLYELAMAERAIDDFWGNENDFNSRFFYFERLARLHLNEMSTSESQKQRVETLLKERKGLATFLREDVNEFIAPMEDVPYSDQPNTTFPHEVRITYKSGLPEGIAAMNLARRNSLDQLYPVEDAQDRRIRKQSVEVDPNPMRQQFTYEIPKIGPFLKREEFAVLLNFRGHESMRTFSAVLPDSIAEEKLIRLQFDPARRQEAQVQVIGGENATSDVLIIIDCSASMRELVVGPDNNEDSRMSNALRMARSLVNSLRKEGNFRVALMAYGHRVNFKRGGRLDASAADLNWNKAWGREKIDKWIIDNRVRPTNDVEILFPLSNRNIYRATQPEEYVELQKQIDGTKLLPHGQTPLYESLIRGAEHLQLYGNPKAERHIVVITDGVNSVYDSDLTLGTQIGDIAELDGSDNVVRFKDRNFDGCRFHMVLYDVQPDRKDRTEQQIKQEERRIARGKKHLIQISKLSGVEEEVIDSSDATEVLAKIDDFIVPNRYTISAKGANDPNGATPLGMTWRAPIAQPGSHSLGVTIRDVLPENLYLYGGENLKIELEGRDFKFTRSPNKVLTDVDVYHLGGRNYRIGMIDVDRPQRVQTFKLGLEVCDERGNRLDREHSDRPQFVSLDIEARSAVTNGATFYRLYDFDFELETSYPIVNFPSIPADPSATYRLRFRVLPQGARPRSFLMRKSVRELPNQDAPIPVNSGSTKMSVSRTGSEVNVTVDSEQPNGVHDVAVVCADAVTIRRVYSQEGDHAEFKFVLKDLDLEKPADIGPQLEIYSMDDLFNTDNGLVEIEFKYP